MTAPYYSDDLVTLYHGDNREITEWLDADAMVTDPPYGRGWRQGRLKDKRGGYKAESASRAGIIGDGSTAARNTALTMWGPDKPAILFGDLMLAPPAAARLVAVYAKPPDAGMRGAIGGVRRDLEAVYLCGTAWTSGLGGRSSLFRTMEAQQGSQHGIVARAGGHPHAKAQDVMRALIGLTPGGGDDRGPLRRVRLHPRRRGLPGPPRHRRGARRGLLRDGRQAPLPGPARPRLTDRGRSRMTTRGGSR